MRALDSEITIRQARIADAAGVARTHVESWRATYRGIVSDETLDGLRIEERTAGWRNVLTGLTRDTPPGQDACYVAVDAADEVVGFACGGLAHPLASGATPEPYDGELYAIYLKPGWERQGIGARLTLAVATHLAAGGLRSLLVWALAENPSRRFYVALGGALVFEQEARIFDQTLPEVGYGWPDIQTLIAHCSVIAGELS